MTQATTKKPTEYATQGICPFCGSNKLGYRREQEADGCSNCNVKCEACGQEFEQCDEKIFSHYSYIDDEGKSQEIYPQ